MFPTGANSAFVTLSMAPGNLVRLGAKVTAMGKTMEDVTIPVMGVKLFKGGKGTALEVPVRPNPKGEAQKVFKGWGIVPIILNIDETKRPESEDIRREMWAFLRKCRGHNNVSGLGTYYAAEDYTPWPEVEAKVLKPEDLWPDYKSPGRERASAANTGKIKPRIVGNLKYDANPRGGYSVNSMSPGIKTKYKDVLVKAANSSLATKTWSSYSTVYNQLPVISAETGVVLSFPMSHSMIQAIIGFYLVKGLRTSTIQGYLASIRNLHQVRGLRCPALDEKLTLTIMKGARNMESLVETESRGVVTVQTLRQLRKKLQESELTLDTKRLLWAVFTILFLGSLRPSEALSIKKGEYDAVKTLTWKDVKLLSSYMDGKEVKFLQLTLKQPKTARSMPTQLVEIPELGGEICAVRAFMKWSEGRKSRQDPSIPVFTMATGDLVTVNYINKVLGVLLSDESPKITARAFRPGLATILARQGASTDELKVLGRWTSKAYEQYIRKGRANNWQNARAQLIKATKFPTFRK